MNECSYKYELDDNLKATKYLLKIKNKQKNNIVTVFLIFITIFGIMVSVGAFINHNNNWSVGIASIFLIVGYFLVDVVIMRIDLNKQRKFFLSSQLNKVSRVKVCYENDLITETFMIKENILGINKYSVNDLTNIKILTPIRG